jgi:MscS family membrane protein
MKRALKSFRVMTTALILLIPMPVLGQTAPPQAPTIKDVVKRTPPQTEAPAPQNQTTPPPKPPPAPPDEYNRSVPRSSVEGFLAAAKSGDYERASQYLDLRNLPYGMTVDQGPDLARQLKVVLDRALWIDLDLLSMDPEGQTEDGLPKNLDYVGTIDSGGRHTDVHLQRVPRKDGVPIWQFSSKTVADIPNLYAAFGYGFLGERLARSLPGGEYLGMKLWQWILLFGLVVVAYLAAFLPTWLLSWLIQRRRNDFSARIARFISGPIRFLVMVLLVRAWFDLIHPSMVSRAVARGQTALIIVTVWMLACIVDLFRDYVVGRLARRQAKAAVLLAKPFANGIKLIMILIATVVWLDNLGFKVTTLLAGLGLGGLAVALAAQKSIENLIACLTLYSSAPVRVGDFCRYGDKLGVVEEIGLRATKIRSLDRTTVHISNATFVGMQLENFASRDRIWFHPTLRLRVDTSPDQIRYILVEVRKLLYAHPRVDNDPARVRFTGFGDSSLNLEVFAYIRTTDYGEYLEIAEDLNLQIMDIVKDAGSTVAIPARSIFKEEVTFTDREAARAAEAKVKEWRHANSMFLPRFPPEAIDELNGTVEYPPKGSAISA